MSKKQISMKWSHEKFYKLVKEIFFYGDISIKDGYGKQVNMLWAKIAKCQDIFLFMVDKKTQIPTIIDDFTIKDKHMEIRWKNGTTVRTGDIDIVRSYAVPPGEIMPLIVVAFGSVDGEDDENSANYIPFFTRGGVLIIHKFDYTEELLNCCHPGRN